VGSDGVSGLETGGLDIESSFYLADLMGYLTSQANDA
jgi:hypothetical protein